ncbi:hypothetical protein Psed_4348 [Pseudonocardia dioxanivorans CB1190]|uniref:Uncharacterized protein n=1 Tax=Pseudonocardia dioxanivorans (strain ATCC 55486 / DSM 44775 / JCM 13855 / CB1190) TaxID=675635 RepID=F4CXD3_PSEUX|nr:hypothetical protein Psed_4348 [Pseudonocardia dioxanivorans CB1190]
MFSRGARRRSRPPTRPAGTIASRTSGNRSSAGYSHRYPPAGHSMIQIGAMSSSPPTAASRVSTPKTRPSPTASSATVRNVPKKPQ